MAASHFLGKYFIFVLAAIVIFTSSFTTSNIHNNAATLTLIPSLPHFITYANAKFVHDVGGDFDPEEFDGVDHLDGDDQDSYGFDNEEDEEDEDEEDTAAQGRIKKNNKPNNNK